MVDDRIDQMERHLEAIRGLLGDQELSPQVNVDQASPPVRVINPAAYVVTETSDHDNANQNGTITCAPGETVRLARYVNQSGISLLAVGATDEPDVEYWVEIDNTRAVGGKTNSPLGVLNNPFSFVQEFGGVIPANQSVAYMARLDENASAPVELIGRLHTEDVSV